MATCLSLRVSGALGTGYNRPQLEWIKYTPEANRQVTGRKVRRHWAKKVKVWVRVVQLVGKEMGSRNEALRTVILFPTTSISEPLIKVTPIAQTIVKWSKIDAVPVERTWTLLHRQLCVFSIFLLYTIFYSNLFWCVFQIWYNWIYLGLTAHLQKIFTSILYPIIFVS